MVRVRKNCTTSHSHIWLRHSVTQSTYSEKNSEKKSIKMFSPHDKIPVCTRATHDPITAGIPIPVTNPTEAESSLDSYHVRTSTPTPTPTGLDNYPSVELPSTFRCLTTSDNTVHNTGDLLPLLNDRASDFDHLRWVLDRQGSYSQSQGSYLQSCRGLR